MNNDHEFNEILYESITLHSGCIESEILRHKFFQLKPMVPYLQHPNNICKHGISCQVK